MGYKPPSYLILRNGIYYFQMRVLAALNRGSEAAFIKRSTRTGNLREAQGIARRWVMKIMTDTIMPSQTVLEDIDEDSEVFAYMYSLGRSIQSELDQIDPGDQNEIAAYL